MHEDFDMDNWDTDEPFHSEPDPFPTVKSEYDNLHCVVPSPLGEELVTLMDCDEPTRIMSREQVLKLMEESSPYRHATVAAMPAVKAA